MSTTLNTDSLQIQGVTLCDSAALSFPSSQRKSYTVTASSGTGIGGFTSVSGYYLDMGAVRMCWAKATATWSSSVAASGTLSLSLPSGLFSSVHNVQLTVQSFDPTMTQGIVCRGASTSTVSFIIFNTTGSTVTSGSAATVHMFVIGG